MTVLNLGQKFPPRTSWPFAKCEDQIVSSSFDMQLIWYANGTLHAALVTLVSSWPYKEMLVICFISTSSHLSSMAVCSTSRPWGRPVHNTTRSFRSFTGSGIVKLCQHYKPCRIMQFCQMHMIPMQVLLDRLSSNPFTAERFPDCVRKAWTRKMIFSCKRPCRVECTLCEANGGCRPLIDS